LASHPVQIGNVHGLARRSERVYGIRGTGINKKTPLSELVKVVYQIARGDGIEQPHTPSFPAKNSGGDTCLQHFSDISGDGAPDRVEGEQVIRLGCQVTLIKVTQHGLRETDNVCMNMK
jgi:hypothetical protein